MEYIRLKILQNVYVRESNFILIHHHIKFPTLLAFLANCQQG